MRCSDCQTRRIDRLYRPPASSNRPHEKRFRKRLSALIIHMSTTLWTIVGRVELMSQSDYARDGSVGGQIKRHRLPDASDLCHAAQGRARLWPTARIHSKGRRCQAGLSQLVAQLAALVEALRAADTDRDRALAAFDTAARSAWEGSSAPPAPEAAPLHKPLPHSADCERRK
jgi:hypothetical protein